MSPTNIYNSKPIDFFRPKCRENFAEILPNFNFKLFHQSTLFCSELRARSVGKLTAEENNATKRKLIMTNRSAVKHLDYYHLLNCKIFRSVFELPYPISSRETARFRVGKKKWLEIEPKISFSASNRRNDILNCEILSRRGGKNINKRWRTNWQVWQADLVKTRCFRLQTLDINNGLSVLPRSRKISF